MTIKSRKQQQGVALITVLLVFALAAIITSEVASRNYRDIRKTANLISSKQAYYYALAGEQYARQILFRDYDDDRGGSDQLTDNWSDITEVFDIDNGAMTIEITDLQGRFNLNNVVTADGRVNNQALSDFIRLLEALDIRADYGPRLIDWLDKNNKISTGGAEDAVYQSLDYLTANQRLTDRSELRLLNDMRFEDYIRLKHSVVALPQQVKDQQIGTTKYNINTLTAKMVEALAGQDYPAMASIQQRGGHSSVNQWMSSGDIGPLSAARNRLITQSEFFEIKVTAVYDQRISIIRSQIHRNNNDGSITLLKRQQGIE